MSIIRARTQPGAGQSTSGQGHYLLRSIIDAGARSEFRQVDERLFLEGELPAYQFVRRFYQAHGQFPTPEACAENGHSLPAGGNPVGYYMRRCLDRAIYNAIVSEQPNLSGAMETRDMVEARGTIHRIARAIGRMTANEDVATINDLLTEVMEDYERAHNNPGMQGTTLGWPYLDQLTGGIEPGDIATFAARPGMGKSWLLTHCARQAWLSGAPVLFVSMEMTGKQIARRFLSMQAGVNPDGIRTGQLSEWTRGMVYEAVESVGHGAPFHMLTGQFDKSVPLIDAAIQEFSPEIVFVDASYLMSPSSSGGARKQFELLTDVAKELKQMVMERNKALVQTVQFNRDAAKAKKRGTEHIGGSDSIGQITTIGLAIREGQPGSETTTRALDVFKNREGPGGEQFTTNFLFNPPSFDQISIATGAADGEPDDGITAENVETVGGI